MSTEQGSRFYAIAPTIYSADGRVDGPAIAACVAQIRHHGVNGVLLTGSYGEFQVLTDDERVEITEAVVRADRDVVVMSGAAGLNTRSAVALGDRLRSAGAHQVMVSAPFAAELTDDDLLVHFADIGDRLRGDLVVYNNPVFGVDLTPTLLAQVTSGSAYHAVKQGTKSLAFMVDTIAQVQVPGHAQVLAAADLACAAAVGAGIGGVTSTNVWVFPEAFLALADPEVPPARKALLLAALRPYADLVRSLGQPRSVKAAMAVRGYPITPHVRRPYRPLDEVETKQMAAVLAEVDDSLARVVDR